MENEEHLIIISALQPRYDAAALNEHLQIIFSDDDRCIGEDITFGINDVFNSNIVQSNALAHNGIVYQFYTTQMIEKELVGVLTSIDGAKPQNDKRKQTMHYKRKARK